MSYFSRISFLGKVRHLSHFGTRPDIVIFEAFIVLMIFVFVIPDVRYRLVFLLYDKVEIVAEY